jgi:hypothetical protein
VEGSAEMICVHAEAEKNIRNAAEQKNEL